MTKTPRGPILSERKIFMKLLSISISLSLGLVLATSFVLPANAQSGADLKPDLTPSFPQLPPTPVPVDQYGNPIPAQQPTAEQVEAMRIERERRLEQARLQEEKAAAENARRAEEERRAAELLAEQKQFHRRVMWVIYIGLGLLAVLVGSRALKRNE
jgi:hypothetical protein